jgi:hypothetical protein
LIADVVGAGFLAWGLFVSRETATKLGSSYYSSAVPEENLQLPPVQDRLRQSRNAMIGLPLLVIGFCLQALGTWWDSSASTVTKSDYELWLGTLGAAGTAITAVFTWLVWKTYERLAWLTGAMESHSTMQLRLAAKKADVPVIWWDPTIEAPPTTPQHKEIATLEQIFLYLPVHRRKRKRKVAAPSVNS